MHAEPWASRIFYFTFPLHGPVTAGVMQQRRMTELRYLYTLSKSFAPPTLGLRGARLIDDHGQTSHADLPANHRDPYDVNEPELDYYFDVWGFLPPTELLFYAFSVIRYAAKHDEPTVYLERWIETIDGKLAMIVGDCDAKQESSLKRMLAEQLNIVSVFELEAIFSYISDS